MIFRERDRLGQAATLLVGAMMSSLLMMGCDPVGTSPEPGLLRVTLQADPADSTITIADQVYNLNEVAAQMYVTVSQGRAYRDTTYAQLFQDPQDLSAEEEIFLNMLRRVGDNQTPEYRVYETLMPPATYDSLQIVFNASQFVVGDFQNEVNLQPGTSPLVTFQQSFQIESNEVTTVNLQMRPLESLTRFKDVFYFNPVLQVASVE